MINTNNVLRRRTFLGTLTSGAAALGLSGLLAPLSVTAGPTELPKPSADTSFEEWLGKIKGKHKQVFDAPMPLKGDIFAWLRVYLMTSKQIGTAADDLTAVAVLRHDAIPLAMDHQLWTKYRLGEEFKITDSATKAPSVRNPYYHPKEGELELSGMAIEDLVKEGVLFGVCDMALTFYSRGIAEKMKMSADDVKKDWVAGLLPGMHVVPSGVLAVNRAQERGCTYCFSGVA